MQKAIKVPITVLAKLRRPHHTLIEELLNPQVAHALLTTNHQVRYGIKNVIAELRLHQALYYSSNSARYLKQPRPKLPQSCTLCSSSTQHILQAGSTRYLVGGVRCNCNCYKCQEASYKYHPYVVLQCNHVSYSAEEENRHHWQQQHLCCFHAD